MQPPGTASARRVRLVFAPSHFITSVNGSGVGASSGVAGTGDGSGAGSGLSVSGAGVEGSGGVGVGGIGAGEGTSAPARNADGLVAAVSTTLVFGEAIILFFRFVESGDESVGLS